MQFPKQKKLRAPASVRLTTASPQPLLERPSGLRQATDVRSVDAERSVDPREEGVKGGEGKGSELDGREVIQEAVGPRTLDRNRKDAPIFACKAGAQGSAQRRGGGN